jgi:hypothetical protein
MAAFGRSRRRNLHGPKRDRVAVIVLRRGGDAMVTGPPRAELRSRARVGIAATRRVTRAAQVWGVCGDGPSDGGRSLAGQAAGLWRSAAPCRPGPTATASGGSRPANSHRSPRRRPAGRRIFSTGRASASPRACPGQARRQIKLGGGVRHSGDPFLARGSSSRKATRKTPRLFSGVSPAIWLAVP